jgi:hypothetical protein
LLDSLIEDENEDKFIVFGESEEDTEPSSTELDALTNTADEKDNELN